MQLRHTKPLSDPVRRVADIGFIVDRLVLQNQSVKCALVLIFGELHEAIRITCIID